MIPYPVFNEITRKINEVSTLTECLFLSSGTFYVKSIEYVEGLKTFSEFHNLYISSDIALCLDNLLLFTKKKDREAMGRINERKEKDAYAVSELEKLIEKIKVFLEKDRKTFDECKDLWRQVLARMISRNVDINTFNNEDKLEKIIKIIKLETELSPYYFHILGFLGTVNTKIILDITLPELNL